jgi:Delta3-Delta2-enoyl-CoA isomerase
MHELRLSAPGKNALSTALMTHIRDELRRAAGAPVLVVGEGDAFSAGLNLKEVAGLDRAGMARFIELLENVVLDLYTYPGPTVACVNGHAIAGGCVVAMCCDARVATDDARARIGLNEVALGLRFPPRVFRLVRERLPPKFRETVLLGAELFAPERARQLGLVDEIASDPEHVARERLTTLAARPADAYAATKRALREGVLEPSAEERARFEQQDLPTWCSDSLKDRVHAMLAR